MARRSGETRSAAHDDQAIADSREGSTGQHHKGWQARERSSSSSAAAAAAAAAAAGCGARSPLKDAGNTNGAAAGAPLGRDEGGGNSTRKNLRPYEIPYANNTAGSAAAASAPERVLGSTGGKGVTLRCMYTSQKTKKRKTWSDGAVKCCPKRQRVSLYRWSEALGVTEKLLGEIYLTVPQYQAFINQTEPDLEMEVFIVSLDGVIQPDSDPSAGTTGAANDPVDGAAAGVSASGTTTTAVPGGKKRKLFKAFKPPARRAPPPAPPSDDAWGLPAGRMDQLRNGDRNGHHHGSSSGARGDGREVLPPRTSYTGFGHVESLWGDDDDDDDDDGGQETLQDRHQGGAGSLGLAGEGNAGWGMGAGAGCRSAYDGRGGGSSSRTGVFPDARSEGVQQQQQQRMQMQSSSSAAAAAASAGNASNWMWGQEDQRHVEMHNNSSSGGSRPPPQLSSRSACGVDGDFDCAPQQQQERPRFADPTHSGQNDPASYQSLRFDGDGGRGACPSSAAGRSGHRGGAQGIDGAGGDHRYDYPGHEQFDVDGSSVQRGGSRLEEEPFERNALSEHGAGARAPEIDREPPVGDDNGSGGGLRSTQDILSLFGGFGGASSTTTTGDLTGHGSRGPREQQQETGATPLLESRGSNEIPLEPGGMGSARMPPVGGGISRAADMRRAQKAARAAAAGAATATATATAGEAAPLSAATTEDETAPATTSDGVASADWACGVCGVRGGPSSTSCRVCGAKRQAPRSGGDIGGGGHYPDHVDGFRGDLRVGNSSDKQGVWGGREFQGGKGKDQGWEGETAGNNDNAHAAWGGIQGDGDDGLGEGGAEKTVSSEGRGLTAGRRSASPSGSAPALHLGDEGGGDGAAGSIPGPSSNHRMVGVRMQMDMGSSSDSDDA